MNSRWATRLSHPQNGSRHVQNTTECLCRRTFCAIKMTCSTKLVGLGWGEAKAHLGKCTRAIWEDCCEAHFLWKTHGFSAGGGGGVY